MTDKQIIECKYKFQSIEKFTGKPYCTLHNETCEFINFACDKNCQIYEDYKQLKAKEQECVELKIYIESNEQQVKEVETLVMDNDRLINELDQLKEQIKYQQNFIDSLLLATNNSEWLNKSILDDEASEIIEKIGMDYIEFEEGKEINAELKAENEELKKQNNQFDIGINEQFSKIIELEGKNNLLNAENSELKGIRDRNFLHALEEQKKANKLKQTLAEIEPILEFYANSTIGEKQEDGTYKILLNGGYIPIYDPKPAREALRIIDEVENEG